jgi:hypothetical protein
MPTDQDTPRRAERPIGAYARRGTKIDELGITDLAAGASAWQRKKVVDAAAPRARGRFMSSI